MKTVLSITLILLTLGVTAQIDSIANRLNYTNYCLYKYQQAQKFSIATELIGVGLIIIGNSNSLNGTDKTNDYWARQIKAADNLEQRIRAERGWEKELKKMDRRRGSYTKAGAAFIIGGGVINVMSYRWLKNAYVYPNERGLTVMVKF